MNKKQAVSQKLKVQKYIQDNKLRPLFHQLTKLLLLKKPQNPIQFLIDYLQKPNKPHLICIIGYHEEKRTKLAKTVQTKFNYKLIEMSQLFKGVADWHSKSDNEISQKVISQLSKVESVYKGVVISGYPNNIVQVDLIQKSGFLPDRYFLLQNDQKEIKKHYMLKFQGDVQKLLQRNRLQLKQLHQILGDLLDQLSANIQNATETLVSTLGIRANRKNIPNDSLRLCVLYPPFLKPQNSEVFVQKFCLNPISVNETLQKLSKKQNFVSNVESYIRKHKSISKQIELAMIETMTKSVISKNKGYTLYGWPNSKDRLPLIREHFLNPHIIFIFDLSKEQSLQKFSSLKTDSPELFLVNQKPSREQYQKIYDQYRSTVDQLNGKNNVHKFEYDESSEKVSSTFLSLLQNPKIYS